jgi:hypothetical protein
MKKRVMVLLLLGGILFFCSCFTITGFRTAKTLEPGHFSVTAGAIVTAPVFCADARVGVFKRFDVGIRYDAIAVEATGKVQVLGYPDQKLALAVEGGYGVGVNTKFFIIGPILSTKFSRVEPYLAYRYYGISFDFGSSHTTKYLDWIFDELEKEHISAHRFNLGAKFGLTKRLALVPELTVFNGDKAKPMFNVGLQFEF